MRNPLIFYYFEKMSYCSVPGCRSGYGRKRDGRHCFKPPKENNLFEKWARVIPQTDKQLSTKSRICDLHFSSDLIVKTDSFVVNGENVELHRVRWKLKPGAVPNSFPNLPKYLSTKVNSRKSLSARRNEENIERTRTKNYNLESHLGIMEEPQFIKSEPEWSPDTKEFLKWESEDSFLTSNATSIKAEAEQSSDAELNANEENRNSICESETQILKEEIIKEEEDINRETDSFDLPASSSVLQESEQDLNSDNDLKCGDEIKHPCLQCNKVYNRAAHLKKHMNDSHNRKGIYECKKCDRIFRWPQNLKDHLKIHGAKKAFQCTRCKKRFLRSSDLKRHNVVHTGKRTLQCPVCPRMFNDASNLRSHIKRHSGARLYCCNICNKAFQTKGNLKKHIMLHNRFV